MVDIWNSRDILKASAESLLIDVRSPSEFAKGHIPGARNLALFDDAQRHDVGLCYAEQGQEQAIQLGLDLVSPKLSSFIRQVEAWQAERTRPAALRLYCWRGGMRSSSMAWLLSTYGWTVATLKGGYKAWRRYALDTFRQPWNIRVLSGHTGCAKTAVLAELRSLGEQVIDLEALAGHKGSAFGWLGEPYQPSQEHFDNRLAMALLAMDPGRPTWLEDESKRIGAVNIPVDLWEQMLLARCVRLHVPTDERVEYLVQEYGRFSIDELCEGIARISQKLGSERAKQADNAVREGDLRLAARICLHYYDKYYQRGMHVRTGQQECIVECAQLGVRERALRVQSASVL